MENYRLVGCEGRDAITYAPSRSELLLEDICKSFGTELENADIESSAGIPMLVRLSKPASIENWFFESQYTRFSPFHSVEKAIAVYYGNRSPKLRGEPSFHKMQKDIRERQKDYDAVNEVLKPNYIPNLQIHKWEKAFYFAVYDLEESKPKSEKPFHIHELDEKFLPEVYIVFNRRPFFVTKNFREDTSGIYDRLSIDLPRIKTGHDSRLNTAFRTCLIDKLKLKEPVKHKSEMRGSCFEVHSGVPIEATMGFIQSYLRQMCLGRVL